MRIFFLRNILFVSINFITLEKIFKPLNMKRYLFLFGIIVSFVCLLASCSKSPEQKVKDLVGTEIKKHLYIPESYDLADVKVDSAFAPYDNPEFIELTQELVKKGHEVEEAETDIKDAESSISIWADPYSSFSRNSLNEARADLKKAQAKEEKSISEAKKLGEKMKKQMDKSPEFIGYKASVSYRAKNNDGDILMSEVFVVFDKNIENITYMMDGKDYEQYQEVLKEIHESRNSDSEEE